MSVLWLRERMSAIPAFAVRVALFRIELGSVGSDYETFQCSPLFGPSTQKSQRLGATKPDNGFAVARAGPEAVDYAGHTCVIDRREAAQDLVLPIVRTFRVQLRSGTPVIIPFI